MAIRIKARSGESAEQLMRRFKKLCEKEGLTKEVKKRAYYEKPSERKQRAARRSTTKRVGPGMPGGREGRTGGGRGGNGGAVSGRGNSNDMR